MLSTLWLLSPSHLSPAAAVHLDSQSHHVDNQDETGGRGQCPVVFCSISGLTLARCGVSRGGWHRLARGGAGRGSEHGTHLQPRAATSNEEEAPGCASAGRSVTQPAMSPASRLNDANMAMVDGSLDRSAGGLGFQMC
jgi:hypothetical protein